MTLHRLAKILVLALMSVETIDGAKRRKPAPAPPAADVQWKKLDSAGTRTLLEESQEPEQTNKQQESRAVVGGMGGQYVDMGAAGFADVELKLDMRAFLAQLNMIPTLEQAVANMGIKIESILEQTKSQQAVFGSQILSLREIIENRLSGGNSRIDNLIQIVQQLLNQANKVEKKLENLDDGLSHVGNAFGASIGIGGCDTSGVEGNVQEVLKSLPQIGNMLEDLIIQVNKNLGILQDNMKNSFGVLQNELSVLHTISQPGFLCPESKGATQTETRILTSLSEIGGSLQRFPEHIITTLPQIVGNRNDTLQVINTLVETEQQIRNDIENVRKQLVESKEEVKKYFAESQKSLQTVKRVVTQTTEIVQSSAAAAISASRSLKCASSKNKKPDLDGE